MHTKPDVVSFKTEYESARCLLIRAGGDAYRLINLASSDRGKGHATELMRRVAKYADENKLTLLLTAQAYGPPRDILSNQQLEDFYRKFGFTVTHTRPTRMIRYPSQEIHTP